MPEKHTFFVLILTGVFVFALSACKPDMPLPAAVEESAAARPESTQPDETKPPEMIAPSTKQPAPTDEPAVAENPLKSPTPKPPTEPAEPQGSPQEGENVMEIESRLFDLGYREVGVPDEIFDHQTGAAVRHFQFLNNLPIDGVANEMVSRVLFDEAAVAFRLPPFFPGEVLRIHPLADHVTGFCNDEPLKQRLADLGYMDTESKEYINWHIYGPDTSEAVILIQEMNGLPADGELGPEDWKAVFSPFAISAGGEQAVSPPGEVDWDTTIFPVFSYSFALTYDGQRIWVAASAGSYRNQNVVMAIDPDAGLTETSLPIMPGDCDAPDNQFTSMVYVEHTHSLWFLFPNTVSDMWATGYVKDRPDVQSLDPDTGMLYVRMPVGTCPDDHCYPSSALGTDGRRLWASSDSRVWTINPTNGVASAPREAGWLISGTMVYDGTCLWMEGESGAAAFHPSGGNCPGGVMAYALPTDALAFDGQRMWGAGYGLVMPLDLATEEVGYGIDVGGDVSALAYDGRVLWAALESADAIQGIDPDTGSMGEPLPVGKGPVDLLFDGERLWILNAGSRTVRYIDPSIYQIDIIIPTSIPTQPTSTPNPTHTVAPAPVFERELSLQTPNLTGDDVLQVQERLADLGYHEVGQPDGVFGPMTGSAVQHFQEINGLVADGVIGPLTWEALFGSDARGP